MAKPDPIRITFADDHEAELVAEALAQFMPTAQAADRLIVKRIRDQIDELLGGSRG